MDSTYIRYMYMYIYILYIIYTIFVSDDSDVRLFNLKDVQIIGCQTAWSLTITGFLRIRRRSGGQGLPSGESFSMDGIQDGAPPVIFVGL